MVGSCVAAQRVERGVLGVAGWGIGVDGGWRVWRREVIVFQRLRAACSAALMALVSSGAVVVVGREFVAISAF